MYLGLLLASGCMSLEVPEEFKVQTGKGLGNSTSAVAMHNYDDLNLD